MKRLIVIFLVVTLVPILIFEFFVSKPNKPQRSQVENPEISDPEGVSPVATLIGNEVLIRQLDRNLALLKRAILNLNFPGEATELFAKNARIRDINALAASKLVGDQGLRKVSLTPLEEQSPERPIHLWGELFRNITYISQAKFYSVRVTQNQGLRRKIETGFSGLAKLKTGGWLAMKASGSIVWQRMDEEQWKIAVFDFDQFDIRERAHTLFEETTSELLSPLDFANVRHSKHYETILRVLRRGEQGFPNETMRNFFPRGGATGRHPSIAVVDINNDGWDDVYIVEQWRKNLLFRNRGDGTFVEETSKYGLDLDGYNSCALFADFDNDGDSDLVLGRSLSQCGYFENENGRFVERTNQKFRFGVPALATALSAADYNNDGLLDIYLSTYGFTGVNTELWTNAFLRPEDRAEVVRLMDLPEYNRFLNATGPPNLLLVNRGDFFELSPFSEQVATWANTFQGTWSDYDNDGDQDLYVANDFCRDYLFRNDQGQGFTDVTLQVGDDTMTGFGMGATWGDFDLDGDQDLYVSNMYSKAGLRITEHFEGLDKRFRRSADGNRLYINDGERLRLVSSNEQAGIDVHNAGWSWGGQFFDVQNDGLLDLYVTSGYFTAPKMFASTQDL